MTIDRAAAMRVAERMLGQWHCVADGAPVLTPSSLLWPVRKGAERLMMKVVDPEDDEVGGAAILAAAEGQGAVRLFARDGAAILIERVDEDGPTLEEMVLTGQDDAATAVIAGVAVRLHGALDRGAVPDGLIPFDRWISDLRAAARQGDGLLRSAAGLAEHLCAETRSDWRPLHGDIHHGNVLCDRDRGWLAIDPKGLFGPRAYDFANTLCNPLPHVGLVADPARMARQAGVIAGATGLDPADLRNWAFVHAAMAAVWSRGGTDHHYWLRVAEVAARLAGQSVA